MEGKEGKIEEREGKGENFQHKSVKALFIHRNQVTLNLKKSFIQISPAFCVVKLNHMQVIFKKLTTSKAQALLISVLACPLSPVPH